MLNGPGQAASLGNYANNDGWFDDVSDGPVRATVVLNGTTAALTAMPAGVICPPPDFAAAFRVGAIKPSAGRVTTPREVRLTSLGRTLQGRV